MKTEEASMAVLDENALRKMGFVCDWCGKVGQIRSCSKGCTKICINCLDNKVKRDGSKGWKFTVCKECGETIRRRG
jgi:hypothetical protein